MYQRIATQCTGYMIAVGFLTRPAALLAAFIYWISFLSAGTPHFVNHFYMKAYVSCHLSSVSGMCRSSRITTIATTSMIITLFACVPETTGLSVDAVLAWLWSRVIRRSNKVHTPSLGHGVCHLSNRAVHLHCQPCHHRTNLYLVWYVAVYLPSFVAHYALLDLYRVLLWRCQQDPR
jgi:hypothetical protein